MVVREKAELPTYPPPLTLECYAGNSLHGPFLLWTRKHLHSLKDWLIRPRCIFQLEFLTVARNSVY